VDLNRQSHSYWDLSVKKTSLLLQLNRDQRGWMVGLLTGHCHLKTYLFKLGFENSLTCERCLEKDESSKPILCVRETIAYLRFRHTDHYIVEPNDHHDTPDGIVCGIYPYALISNQNTFLFNLFFFLELCGGRLQYLHRSPASRKRPGGYNWATLFLGDINKGT
jgi:hypothetical protein